MSRIGSGFTVDDMAIPPVPLAVARSTYFCRPTNSERAHGVSMVGIGLSWLHVDEQEQAYIAIERTG